MGRRDLKRGASAAFGGMADMVMFDYQASIQARHEKAMERVRHQYRMAEGQEAGLIAGQAADVKYGRDVELQKQKAGLRDPGERTRAAERMQIEDPALSFKEAFSEAGPQRGATAASIAAKYVDAEGRAYTFKELDAMYKSSYPGGYGPGGAVTFDDYLQEKGIQLSGGAPGAPPAPGAQASSGGENENLKQQAIAALREGKGSAAQFDEIFGEGAAKEAMGSGFKPAAESGPGIVGAAEQPSAKKSKYPPTPRELTVREVRKEFDRQIGVWEQAKWTSDPEGTKAEARDWLTLYIQYLTPKQRAKAKPLLKSFGFPD